MKFVSWLASREERVSLRWRDDLVASRFGLLSGLVISVMVSSEYLAFLFVRIDFYVDFTMSFSGCLATSVWFFFGRRARSSKSLISLVGVEMILACLILRSSI